MTMIDDIINQRDRACDILTDQITVATRLKNSGADNLDDNIAALAQRRADISAQAYEAMLTDPAMTAALNAIKAVTKDMTDTAAKMTTATAFLTNVNTLLATANKIIPILRGTTTTA